MCACVRSNLPGLLSHSVIRGFSARESYSDLRRERFVGLIKIFFFSLPFFLNSHVPVTCFPLFLVSLSLSLRSSFDLVTNGGIAVALHFERAPFITQEHTLWLPWGRFFVMDTIVMRHEENDIPGCDLSSFTRPSPVVSPAPLTAFAGSCAERRTVVPEIQVMRRPAAPPPGSPLGRTEFWSRSRGEKKPGETVTTLREEHKRKCESRPRCDFYLAPWSPGFIYSASLSRPAAD